jgi:peptidoglycan lytic transglycosylase
MKNLRMSRPGYPCRFDPAGALKSRNRSGRGRYLSRLSVLLSTSLVLGGCSLWKEELNHGGNPRLVEYGQPVPKGGGVYKVGKPYQIDGKWYYPKEVKNYSHVGVASWYGLDFHGRRTANGEIYDMDSLSAAHPTLPLPSYAKVENLENGREVVVRVNDRGPYARDREIDLSKHAAQLLAFQKQGTAKVRVTYLGPAPMSGEDGWPVNVQFAENRNDGDRAKPVINRPIRLASAAPDPIMPLRSEPAPAPRSSFAAAPIVPTGHFSLPPSYAPAEQATAMIQAGSFRDPDNAERLKSALASVGPVEVTPISVGNVTYYRVRVGPLPDGEEARNALSRVRAAGIGDARLIMTQ